MYHSLFSARFAAFNVGHTYNQLQSLTLSCRMSTRHLSVAYKFHTVCKLLHFIYNTCSVLFCAYVINSASLCLYRLLIFPYVPGFYVASFSDPWGSCVRSPIQAVINYISVYALSFPIRRPSPTVRHQSPGFLSQLGSFICKGG